jgi:hypothetical protein
MSYELTCECECECECVDRHDQRPQTQTIGYVPSLFEIELYIRVFSLVTQYSVLYYVIQAGLFEATTPMPTPTPNS